MTNDEAIERNERTLQERASRLVQHEVNCCVSGVAERMFEHEPDLREQLENEWVRVCPECGEHVPHDAENEDADPDDDDAVDAWPCDSCGVRIDLEGTDIETEPQEVYEWWAISDWLADKLAAQGCVLHRDFYGLTVWGRCTTGQAISIDYVIERIVRDMYAEDDAEETST